MTINYMVSHQLQDLTMEETSKKYHTPANCASLKVPTVNHPLWGHMGAGIRAQELRLQKILKLLASGITAFAGSLDGGALSEVQQDALDLMCNTHFEINCLRKSAIRPMLNPKFAALCKTSNVQSPNLLFGDDYSKQVRELDHKAKTVGLINAQPTSKNPLRRRTQNENSHPTSLCING